MSDLILSPNNHVAEINGIKLFMNDDDYKKRRVACVSQQFEEYLENIYPDCDAINMMCRVDRLFTEHRSKLTDLRIVKIIG